MIIYIKNLECYKNAPNEKKEKIHLNRGFDLDRYPNRSIQEEMKKYVEYIGSYMSLGSMNARVGQFNQLGDFLRSEMPEMETFKGIDSEELQKKAKIWLAKHGKKIMCRRVRTDTGNVESQHPDLIKIIRSVLLFFNPLELDFSFDNDRWYIQSLPIKVINNPVNSIKSISFNGIKQENIKKEVKQVAYHRLTIRALNTVTQEIGITKKFCDFLFEKYPHIDSLTKLNRQIIEDFLVHMNSSKSQGGISNKNISRLKSVFTTAAMILECSPLMNLIFDSDGLKETKKLYKCYSDAELKRLNDAICKLDKQMARLLVLHQLLGTRICEALTLKRDSVYINDEGIIIMKIYQSKTKKYREIPIDEKIKSIFDKACEETIKMYGDTEYVFVDKKDPTKPMKYTKVKYHLTKMITQNDLRDDNGDLFGVGTHMFRHNYGKKLTEMHDDDVVIAKAMGHANTSSLQYYRKMGDEKISKETEKMWEYMDQTYGPIVRGWSKK